ncbi:Uncharacterised protein [Mycobacteroides abscessus subsp. abscessus]|nr:Uncharacterised protein [Mycobacteroides abscessus subsp. abscessus]
MFFGPCACSTEIPAAASCGAAPAIASFRLRAPCEPPNTSSTGPASGSPKCARASARSAVRSSAVMDSRTGMPTTSAPGNPESGTAASTARATLAPILLAMPAFALASCTITGTARRRRSTPRPAAR